MTTAGTKWSGWRGSCPPGLSPPLAFPASRRPWDGLRQTAKGSPKGETPGTAAHQRVAEASSFKRRSNHTRTVRRRRAEREGGTTGRDAWRWLSVRHILGDAARWRDARREERPEAQPVTVQGQGGSWRVANTVDFGTTLQPTRLRSNERGEDGAPYTLCEATLTAPPPHRSLAL